MSDEARILPAVIEERLAAIDRHRSDSANNNGVVTARILTDDLTLASRDGTGENGASEFAYRVSERGELIVGFGGKEIADRLLIGGEKV